MTTTAPQLLPYLERLLDGETVEWKTLGEVCEYIRGITYNKAAETNDSDGWKVLRANNISLTTRTLNFNEVKRVKKTTKVSDKQKLYKGDILICAASGSKEHIGKTAYIESNTPYTFGGFMGVLRVKENTSISSRYLFHYLGSSIFTNYLSAALKSSTINNLNSGIISPFPIPLPPLRVQARIVEILDKFTQLETELEAELEARNKQYDFYRNRLLDFVHRDDFDGKVKWKTLEEAFNTRNGYTPSKINDDFWKDGTIPWFRMDDIRANGRILYDSALHITPQAVKRNGLFKANSIILATSATIGEHALLQQDALTNQRFTNFEIKEELQELLLPKFAFYYFFIIDEWCKKHTIIGNFPSVDTQQLMEQPFPLPPLSEQRRIVEILDRFDTLTNSISEGLPREIALRRKQYEYYRDALLRFPPPAPTA